MLLANMSEEPVKQPIIPYQFEPVKSSDSEHSDDGWETVEEEEEVEERLQKEKRAELESDLWCLCTNCQRMKTAVECICCQEVEETKIILEQQNISK